MRYTLLRPGHRPAEVADPQTFEAPEGPWWVRVQGRFEDPARLSEALSRRGRIDHLELKGVRSLAPLAGHALRGLRLPECALQTPEALADLPLERLELPQAPLRAGLGWLSGLTTLRELDLREGEGLIDEALLVLAGLPLERLILRGHHALTGRFLSALAGAPLRELDLSGTALVHHHLEHLRGLPLERLALARTPLWDLQRALQALEARADTDVEARMALAEGWEERFEFRFDEGHGEPFYVEDPEPTEDDDDPAELLPLGAAEDPTEDRFQRARRLLDATAVFDLDLAELAGPLTGLEVLATLPLRRLDLGQTPIEACPALPDSLRVLSLAETRVRHLDRLPGGLTGLDIHGLRAGLPALPELEGLRWGDAPVDLPDLPKLSALDLTQAELSHLRLPATLTTLSLRGCDLGGLDLGELAGLPHLSDLDLSRAQVGETPNWRGLSQVKRLLLLRAELPGTAGLEALGGLEVLSLTFTRLPEDEVDALREALPDCRVDWAPPPEEG